MAIIPDQSGKNISIDTPQQQRSRKMTAIFVGILIFTAGVIYFGFFSGQNSAPPVDNSLSALGAIPGSVNGTMVSLTSKENQNNAVLESLRQTTLENTFFSGKQLDFLTVSDKLPIVIGVKGRDNPFAPF